MLLCLKLKSPFSLTRAFLPVRPRSVKNRRALRTFTSSGWSLYFGYFRWMTEEKFSPLPQHRYDILRTVNVRDNPAPRLSFITVPSKIWILSRAPSTTLTCTFTLSPGAKSGRSFLNIQSSIDLVMSCTTILTSFQQAFHTLLFNAADRLRYTEQ